MTDLPSLGGDTAGGPKRVTRTGLALVHENELVFPAAGSEAQAMQAAADARSTVHVYFPVEIEVRSAEPEEDAEAAARRLLASVVQRLRNTA